MKITFTRDLATSLLTIVLIAAIALWVALNSYWITVTVPMPLKGEAALNPYYSLERTLAALGVRSQKIASLRALPSTGNVLLIGDLGNNADHARLELLERWITGGGRLIVTGDTIWTTPELQTWSGIIPAPLGVRGSTVREPAECVPMAVENNGVATGDKLTICILASEVGFASKRVPSWAAANNQGLQFLRIRSGDGELVVFGPTYLLKPQAFLRKDTALAFIEAARLRRGDHVFIYSAAKAEPLLSMLWRTAAPAISFSALTILLLIWRHWPRFGPAAPILVSARRSLAEQLRANARFAWRTRHLSHLRTAARRALEQSAAAHVMGFAALDSRQRAAALAAATHVDPAALQAALTDDAIFNAGAERAAIYLLEQTRRALPS